jgi:hypothetical protein
MTVLWTALIVIGLLMISLAVWPSIRDRGRTPATSEQAAETEGDRPGMPESG